MIEENEIKTAVIKKGIESFYDMKYSNASNKSKANAARRYTEMMCKELLVDKLNDDNKELLKKEKILFNMINILKTEYENEIIEKLEEIRKIGNKASHYNDEIITDIETDNIIESALSLFDLILVDELKNRKLNLGNRRDTIFSILPTSTRINVLEKLFNPKKINCEYELGVLHKYILALVKDGRKEEAVNTLLFAEKENEIVTNYFVKEELDTIKKIYSDKKENKLPIPNNINDCKRNFDELFSRLRDEEKLSNIRLIKIIEKLVNDFKPSQFNGEEIEKKYPSIYK